jgi:hypothetical protein
MGFTIVERSTMTPLTREFSLVEIVNASSTRYKLGVKMFRSSLYSCSDAKVYCLLGNENLFEFKVSSANAIAIGNVKVLGNVDISRGRDQEATMFLGLTPKSTMLFWLLL